MNISCYKKISDILFVTLFGYRIYRNKDILYSNLNHINLKKIINPILFCLGGYLEYQFIQCIYPFHFIYQTIYILDEIYFYKNKIEYKKK